MDVDGAVVGLELDEAHQRLVVDDRRGVGHGADRRVAALRRDDGPADDRLLVLAARLPEVDVHVDEARQYETAARVYHLVRLLEDDAVAGPLDGGPVDQQVGRAVDTVRGVYHPSVFYEYLHDITLC